VKESERLSKPEWLILSGILLLTLILRLLFIGQRGIWYDDAFSILLSRRSFPEIFAGTAADTMPPLYYGLLHFWMMVSQNLIWIRLLNIVLDFVLIGYVFLFVQKIFSKQAALISVYFLGISPFLIYHAQEVRMYMVLVLCQFAYMYYFLLWLENKRSIKKIVGMILFGAGALYSHNLAIFGLIIPGIYLIFKKDFSSLLHWIGYLIGSMVLFSPWLIFVPGQIEKIQTAFWTPRPGIVEIIQSVLSLLSYLPMTNLWMMVSGVLCFQILALLLWISWKERRLSPYIGFVFLLIFSLPMLLFVVSYLMRPVYVARGFILSLLGIYVLAGMQCWKYWGSGLDKIILGLFTVLAIISLPFQYAFSTFPRSPFQALCQYLENSDPDALILHDNKLSAFPSIVYDENLQHKFLADETGSHNDTYAYASQVSMQIFPEKSVESAVSGKNDVYFIVFERAIQEYEALPDGVHPILVYLDQEFNEIEITHFNDLAVYHYVR
jgi:4-amino-4-deoxy-L-arabinose transferase-like glycosyltransferase